MVEALRYFFNVGDDEVAVRDRRSGRVVAEFHVGMRGEPPERAVERARRHCERLDAEDREHATSDGVDPKAAATEVPSPGIAPADR